MKNIIQLTGFVLISTILFSCSTSKQDGFAKRKYLDKHYAKKQKFDKQHVVYDYELNAIESKALIHEEAVAALNTELLPKQEVKTISGKRTEKQTPAVAKEAATKKNLDEVAISVLPNFNKRVKVKNQPANALKAAEVNTLLLVIIAILLPPLAVYLFEGSITTNFWIDLILTLLFWLPGIIFALIVIL